MGEREGVGDEGEVSEEGAGIKSRTGLVNYLASIGSLPSYQAQAEVSHTWVRGRG